MNFLLTNKSGIKLENFKQDSKQGIVCEKVNGWNLFTNSTSELNNTSTFTSISYGYVKDLSYPSGDMKSQLENCVNLLGRDWPLPPNITGSFSATLIDNKTGELILCNDLIGIYPLYYLKFNGEFFVSNSIIWIGMISGCKRDEAGVFQRCFGPEFCNLGTRTILRDCKRLLPGEWLKFNSSGDLKQSKYDNSLYSKIPKNGDIRADTDNYWKAFKKELKYCLSGFEKVNLALSGGMDSRILLAGIPQKKKLRCLTYGADENYETKIARKLAKIKKADFSNFSNPSLNFPSIEILEKYTLETEGIHLCSWLEILENVERTEQPLLIGDLSTAITGRTIRKFSSKSYQKNNFLQHTLFNKAYDFEPNIEKTFEAWIISIVKKFQRFYTQTNIDRLGLDIKLHKLKDSLEEDLSSLFERIRSHDIPYIELVDELFTWYTHTRFPMGKQVLINNSKYNTFCPALSINLIRTASNIHPGFRVNLGFVRKLFQEKEELKVLGKVPTSQVPIVPMNFPHLLRIPIWGMRTKLDDYLIKKLVKEEDPTKRYRLFSSNNWVEVYQSKDLEKNLNEYFEIRGLGEDFLKMVKKQALQRRKLKQWPFANMNIMNAAALNTELNMIFNH